MAEHPILFNGEMIRAILDGRKTQTRRVITPRTCTILGYPGSQLWDHLRWDEEPIVRDSCPSFEYLHVPARHPEDNAADCEGMSYRVRPIWYVVDRLWVRETWAVAPNYDSVKPRDLPEGPNVLYKADGGVIGGKWRPSIHMPRWASRITLEVTGVRVERVQEIGCDGHHAKDVLAEGIPEAAIAHEREWFHPDDAPAIAFKRLWDSINGKRPGCAWASNPWVWVIVFKRA